MVPGGQRCRGGTTSGPGCTTQDSSCSSRRHSHTCGQQPWAGCSPTCSTACAAHAPSTPKPCAEAPQLHQHTVSRRASRCPGSKVILVLCLSYLALWVEPAAAARRLAENGQSHAKTTQSPLQEGPSTDPLGITQLEYEGWVDGGQHQACMDLFVARTQAVTCSAIPPPPGWRGPPVAAELCSMPGGDVLVSIVTALDLQAVFQAHLVGPQIKVLPISTCAVAMRNEAMGAPAVRSLADSATSEAGGSHGRGRRRAAAHQLLVNDVVPGDYELTLRMMYANFSYSRERTPTAESACGDPLWRLPLHIDASTGSGCTYCEPMPEAWPVCRTTYVEGAVLSEDRENGTEIQKAIGRDPAVWKGVIRYQPKGCHFVPREEIKLEQCMADRLVCFVGDSHSRHAHNGFVDALQDQGVYAVNGTPFVDIYQHPRSRFIWESWGALEDVEARGQLEGCTDVIFGVGAWPLSNKIVRWTAGHFARVLSKAFKAAQRMQHTEVDGRARRVYFMTTPFHVHTCTDARESRTPPFVALFNRVAVAVAKWYGIGVINTVDVSEPMAATAHDKIHHHYVGFVGSTITEYILNVLCVQQQQQRQQ